MPENKLKYAESAVLVHPVRGETWSIVGSGSGITNFSVTQSGQVDSAWELEYLNISGTENGKAFVLIDGIVKWASHFPAGGACGQHINNILNTGASGQITVTAEMEIAGDIFISAGGEDLIKKDSALGKPITDF